MTSEVKGMMSTEIFDLDNYRPDDYESFSFLISVTVGVKDVAGGDIFDIDVCSPKWLLQNQSDDFFVGSGSLIVFTCDMRKIISKVRALFDGCEGNDWSEIAIKLSRIGRWEFENYRP